MSNNIMSNSQIWANTGTDGAFAQSGTDRLASDKNTFLKLLVAQLTHQDPLNPTEDKEFVAQLAQFTSLEQLQEINAGMSTLNTTMNQSQIMTATGFIGKDVVTNGNQITKFSSAGQIYTTRSWFTIDEDMAEGQANIFDSSGNLVYSENITARSAGSYQFDWKGLNLAGQEVPSGVYEIRIAALDKNDKSILVKQQFAARVVGVMNEEGVYKLILDGGRVVPITDVTEVSNAAESTGTITSYSGQAADASAAASIAADEAELYAQKTMGSSTADEAKTNALAATDAAVKSKNAATSARKAADNARSEAESLKTAESLDESAKTSDHATKAEAYATRAEETAQAAKDWATANFGVEF